MSKRLESSDTRIGKIKRQVTLRGTRHLMFDRYPGDNDTKLQWHQKIYLVPRSSAMALPVINMLSFLTAHNTNSAPKRLRDKRKYKDIANAILSYVDLEGPEDTPEYLPITRNGEPILVGSFEPDHDPTSGLYLHRSVARLDKGIPNPKERPVLPTPWEVSFSLTIRPNNEIKEQEIKNLIQEGGEAIGLGTFRGVYGKFEVATWE